jgi:hypothetical protein
MIHSKTTRISGLITQNEWRRELGLNIRLNLTRDRFKKGDNTTRFVGSNPTPAPEFQPYSEVIWSKEDHFWTLRAGLKLEHAFTGKARDVSSTSMLYM